jgi:serine/threonine protein kinase
MSAEARAPAAPAAAPPQTRRVTEELCNRFRLSVGSRRERQRLQLDEACRSVEAAMREGSLSEEDAKADLARAAKAREDAVENHAQYGAIEKIHNTVHGQLLRGCRVFPDGRREAVALKLSVPADRRNRLLENPENEVELLDIIQAHGGHPRIASMLDNQRVIFKGEQFDLLVLEYCSEGEALAYLSAFRRRRNEEEPPALVAREENLVRAIARDVLAGLQFLHGLGICHLDISVENILVHNGRAKLCDFGMAQRVARGQLLHDNAAGAIRGKLDYAAPEIYNRERYNPFLCDVYSLGVSILVLLLTGNYYGRPGDFGNRVRQMAHNLRGLGEREARAGIVGMARLASISDDAVELLQRMLAPAAERLTLEQVAAHRWFRAA